MLSDTCDIQIFVCVMDKFLYRYECTERIICFMHIYYPCGVLVKVGSAILHLTGNLISFYWNRHRRDAYHHIFLLYNNINNIMKLTYILYKSGIFWLDVISHRISLAPLRIIIKEKASFFNCDRMTSHDMNCTKNVKHTQRTNYSRRWWRKDQWTELTAGCLSSLGSE